jgi:hypothetical protein
MVVDSTPTFYASFYASKHSVMDIANSDGSRNIEHLHVFHRAWVPVAHLNLVGVLSFLPWPPESKGPCKFDPPKLLGAAHLYPFGLTFCPRRGVLGCISIECPS